MAGASRILIRGGTIVDGGGVGGTRRGDVLVDGETIAAVGSVDPAAADQATVIDASGALVIPGGIDVHTHFALPVGAVTSADDFTSGTVAAACGGTTCIIDFAGAGREPWEEALATWHERADGNAVVDYGFHLTVTDLPKAPDAAAARFDAFAREGVTSVKLYLAYPDRLMVDDEMLERALIASAATGVRVCVHAEDGAAIEAAVAEALAAGRAGVDTIPAVRPPATEAYAIHRAARLAKRARAFLYVVHLSSAAGLSAVCLARDAGADVHAETCPHYLHLDNSHLLAGDQNFVCAPPLRTPDDQKALWRGIAQREIDVVSTDHCPFTQADRDRGTAGAGWRDFTQVPGGLSGVEARVALTYQGVVDGRISVERWVEVVATAPARLFGIDHRKGSLAPGLDADVVVFDPGATRTLDAGALHSRSDHSAYEGRTVRGWPALTLARGRVVARDGEPAGVEPGGGRYVRRTRLNRPTTG